MLDPESKGVAQVNAEQSLSRVLAYRVWEDQRRGWRFTNPNLEELGLVTAEYVSLGDLAEDDAAFVNAPPELRFAKPETRRAALVELLDSLAPWTGSHGRRARPGYGRCQLQMLRDKTCAIPGQYRRRRNRGLLAPSSSTLRAGPMLACVVSRW